MFFIYMHYFIYNKKIKSISFKLTFLKKVKNNKKIIIKVKRKIKIIKMSQAKKNNKNEKSK